MVDVATQRDTHNSSKLLSKVVYVVSKIILPKVVLEVACKPKIKALSVHLMPNHFLQTKEVTMKHEED